MNDNLKKAIRDRNVILFVGAGVSATLKLPTWSQLIEHIASELGYDAEIFNQYGDSLLLAEYYVIKKGRIGELRRWMDRNWLIDADKIQHSRIYELIVQLNSPLIYTTNYDCCLESAYDIWKKDYKKIVGVDDLVGLDPMTTQIIKFHGDTISDESIVLTESSYFRRLDFESPLDIKLRSDMLGKSLLFLGYSMTDINMRLLIYKLDRLWKNNNNIDKRPPSYIFFPEPNPIQETILAQRGNNTIVGEGIDKKESLEKFLESLL